MNKTQTPTHTLVASVTRGPTYVANGKPHRKKVGAVVAVIENGACMIGWSLCNYKQGDRYNAELAIELAKGRALSQGPCSIVCQTKKGPTTPELMASGVPQSCISAIAELVSRAKQNYSIQSIQIYCQKRPVVSPPKPLW